MKTLHEEFKEYENLWEEAKTLNENFDDGFKKAFEEFKSYLANPENRAKYNTATSQEQSAIEKPVDSELDKMLDSYDDIELEYDGFEREWYEDHYSHISGHYTTGGTTRYPDFTYEIDATSAYEAIDTVLYRYSSGKIKTSLPSDKYAQEVFKLYTNKKNTKNDAAAEMIAHFEYVYYITYNLEELVAVFYDEIKEIHYKYAMEWAEEYLEGDYDDDGYDYDDYDD